MDYSKKNLIGLSKKSLEKIFEKYSFNKFPSKVRKAFVGIRAFAKEYNAHIIRDDAGLFLYALCREFKFQRALEFGTSIGYSTAWIAYGLGGKGELMTMEKREDLKKIAQATIFNLGEATEDVAKVEFVIGDALNQAEKFAEKLSPKFDFVLIDFAKKKYTEAFKKVSAMLSENGLIVADNTNAHGAFGASEYWHQAKKAPKSFIDGIRNFRRFLDSNKNFKTIYMDIGDGVSVSGKK